MASFSVVSNISSANAQANLQSTSLGLNKAINRLSSGFRINTAGDDAAGLAVANTYRTLSPLPVARGAAMAGLIDGKLIYSSGKNHGWQRDTYIGTFFS